MSTGSSHAWKRATAAVATAVLALSLAACSSDTKESPDSTGDQTSTNGSQQPAADHDLSVAIQVAPNSFDPAQLNDGQQAFVWGSILDTLLVRENGTGELKPNAAESWSYNEDGTQLTIKLRTGMTFSSGDPVTAESVRATMQRTIDTPGITQGKFAKVSGVSAPDDTTLVIDFSSFDPAFLPYLAQSAGAIGDPATLNDERTATDPVGSGPYTLDTAKTVAGNTYVLERRDDYWNAEAFPFSRVTISVMPDPTAQFNALQSGQINAAQIRGEMLAPIKNDPSYTQTQVDAQAVMTLNIFDRAGEAFPELGDVRVRQAMSMAFDRETIVSKLLGGQGTVAGQMFSPLGKVFEDSLNNKYPYDPEQAKKLLAEAGYPNGFTLKIPSTYVTTAFEPTITQLLGAIGITLDWVAVPPQQAQSVTQSGEFGITFQAIGLSSDASTASDFYSENGFNNPRHFTDPKLAEIFGKINTTVDPAASLPYYQELNEYAIDQAFLVPIAFSSGIWVTRDGVKMLDNGANGFSTVHLFGYEG